MTLATGTDRRAAVSASGEGALRVARAPAPGGGARQAVQAMLPLSGHAPAADHPVGPTGRGADPAFADCDSALLPEAPMALRREACG